MRIMAIGWCAITTACGSVHGTTGDAAVNPSTDAGDTGSDAAVRAPGDVVWVRSLSSLAPYGVAVGASGIVVAGSITAVADLGGGPLVSAGEYDLVVAGFATADAAHLYSTRYGSQGSEFGFLSAVDDSGQPIIRGVTYGDVDIGAGKVTGFGPDNVDAFVGRYEPHGAQWTHRIATTGEEKFLSEGRGPGGLLYATGFFTDTATIDGQTVTGTAGRDAMIFGFDIRTGAVQLAKAYPGPGANEGTGVVGRGADIYFAGCFDGSMALGATNLISAGARDIFVAKLDSTGAPLWAERFGGTGDECDALMSLDSAGNIYLAGAYQDSVSFGEVALTSAGSFDVYVAKLDPEGQVQWARSIGSTGNDNTLGMAVDPSGRAVVIGSSAATLDIGIGHPSDRDAFVVSYEPNGQLRWKRSIGSTANDSGWGIAIGGDASVYATVDAGGPIDLGVPVIGAGSEPPVGLLIKLEP